MIEVPARRRSAGAADHGDPAAAPRLPRRRAPGLRRGPAAQPRQERHGRVDGASSAARRPAAEPGFALAPRRSAGTIDWCHAELERLLDDLNPAQREAVTAGDGPLLVLAGAGSGKTRVIAHRIAYLLGVRGRVAAQPPRRHLHQQGGGGDGPPGGGAPAARSGSGRRSSPPSTRRACGSCASTRAHSGLPAAFMIYDEDDRLAPGEGVHAELRSRRARLDARRRRAPHQPRQEPDDRASTTARADARGPREERIALALLARYEERLRAAGAVDFDDLLLLTVRLCEEVPEVARLVPRALALRPGRRVPGHQPRPVPDHPAA